VKGFALKFSELQNWAIPGRSTATACPPGWRPLKLGRILRQLEHRDRIAAGRQYAMAGVKWYGEGLFLRETVSGAGMSASQVYPLVPDALIYNRLFAWKASFAVVPVNAAGWHVSNEFPQFTVDAALSTPEYLRLFCLSQPVLDAVNRASAGSAAVSRNRLKESAFLDLDIALPPLSTQRAIVAHWDAAQADAATMVHEAEGIEREATSAFLAALGFATPNAQTRQRAFAVRWSEAERWGLEWHQQRLGGASIEAGKYPAVPLGELLDRVQYGTSDKANTEKRGVTVLRMNNIVDGRIDTTDLKHVPLPQEDIDRWRLKSGDILFNRTNSKELVGKCAVFDLTLTAVFASYLIRIVVDTKKADAHFIATIINGPVGRQQIDTMSRQIIGQANINSEELKSLRIPLPPLSIQTALVAAFTSARQDADALRAQARQRRETARTEVEAMILGRLPAPATTPAAPLTRPSNTHSRNGSGRKQKPLP
jgi:hypothetical protein